MSGTIADLFQMLCDPSSRKETSAALTILSTLAFTCWTGTSSGTYARKHRANGDSPWSFPTAVQTRSARYWSLLRKLGGKRSSPPPDISIPFEGKTHSSLKAIARAFNRKFTASTVPQERTFRRLMREIHRLQLVDPSYRPLIQCHFVVTLLYAPPTLMHAPPSFAKFRGDQAIDLELNAQHEVRLTISSSRASTAVERE